MDTILVTGGAGYIGSHTCKSLKEHGYLPVTIDNLVQGHRSAVQWGPLLVGDITDGNFLDQVFSQYEPKAVIHFAAHAYVEESMQNPAKYYQNNVVGTMSLLQAMDRHGCRRIVFSSSCATYGIPKEIPIPENYPQHPINPYGRSKYMAEQIIQDMGVAQDFPIQYTILRYFNAAGADPDGRIGEEHDPETHLIPILLQAALRKRSYVNVFGTDYPTPDGTAIRDFVHVSDLSEAHVLALATKNNLIVNLGTGCGYSVMQVLRAAEDVCDVRIPYQLHSRREGDPPVLVAKIDRARDVLKWVPKYSDLHTIIRTARDWMVR